MRKFISLLTAFALIFSVVPGVLAETSSTVQVETKANTPVSIQLVGDETDSQTGTFTITVEPTNGSLSDLSESTGTVTYTPTEDYIGNDSFSYTFTPESGSASDEKLVEISVVADEATPTPTAEPSPTEEPENLLIYEDLGEHWASYSAGKLGELGIIVGETINGKHYFYPDKIMTRAEFALFLVHVLEINPEAMSWSENPGLFADEDQIPAWVRDEARAAKLAGIINGSELDGQVYFLPNDTITRAEAVTMLNNAAMPTSYNNDDLPFADADQIPSWAVTPIKNMVGWGLIDGFEDNTFRPDSTITRAQAIEMMWQLRKFNNVPDASARTIQTKGINKMQDMNLK